MAAALTAQSWSGGNCTTRKTLPACGGATCIGSLHGSCSVLPLLSAGVENVFQKSVTAKIRLIHHRHDMWRCRIGNDDGLAVCVMAGDDTTKGSDLGPWDSLRGSG